MAECTDVGMLASIASLYVKVCECCVYFGVDHLYSVRLSGFFKYRKSGSSSEISEFFSVLELQTLCSIFEMGRNRKKCLRGWPNFYFFSNKLC